MILNYKKMEVLDNEAVLNCTLGCFEQVMVELVSFNCTSFIFLFHNLNL